MAPILFYLGAVPIPGYWFATMMGLAVTHAYLAYNNRRSQGRIGFVHIHNLSCIAMFSIYLGGMALGQLVRLPYLIENWETVKGSFLSDASSHRAFYGGVIMLVLCFWWYIRRYRLDGGHIISLFAPGAALFMVFGRLGCFLAGCCYGLPASWGIVFPEGSLGPAGVTLIPTQLFEAAGHLAIFLLLHLLRKRVERPLSLFIIYAFLYGILRFILEFFRGDPNRGFVLGLSTSQWIGMIIVIAVGVYWAAKRKKQ